jgi:hypothetical protein
MIVYEVKTKKSIETVKEKAEKFFGTDGLGMKITNDDPCCISFSGGGGFVGINFSEDKNDKKITVELQSREWDYQVNKFTELL